MLATTKDATDCLRIAKMRRSHVVTDKNSVQFQLQELNNVLSQKLYKTQTLLKIRTDNVKAGIVICCMQTRHIIRKSNTLKDPSPLIL